MGILQGKVYKKNKGKSVRMEKLKKIKALKKYKWLKNIVSNGISIVSRISPTLGTKLVYYITMEKKLDLKNPKTLNEKIQYLKLNDYKNNELISTMVDKYRVREYLTKSGAGGALAKLYGAYDSVEELEQDLDKLPKRFVLKCNHDSGSIIICHDKDNFDWKSTKEKLRKALKNDYWTRHVEIQYKYINKRKIICEEYLEDGYEGLITYKFFCFYGVPRFLYAAFIKNGESIINCYDMEFIPIKMSRKHEGQDYSIKKPDNWSELVNTARRLSKPLPFVRVDLYSCYGKVYFSEFTVCPTGGLIKYNEAGVDEKLGELLELKELRH
ncbi:MAG: hypothetical protein NC313_07345 [Butyrivibrio sp.]|nr:hypothetical protein [Butyrivibrio sp.]